MKLIATGNTAEVFEYKEDKVLKLFKAGYPLEQIQREFNNTVIMNKICEFNSAAKKKCCKIKIRHGAEKWKRILNLKIKSIL